MSYTIQTAKNDLQGVLHGTTLSQITNLNGVFNRAARQLLLDVDPQETKRTVEFVNPIFNGVFDYPIAADLKGNAIIDIRPQVRRLPVDTWTQAYNQAFDIAKQNIWNLGDMFTMNFNTGLKTLRVNAPYLNAPTIINSADSITSNGTWSLSGSFMSGLAVDNVNFVQGSGSLQFTLGAGGQTGSIVNSTMAAVNLTTVQNQASFFFWVYIPDYTVVASLGFDVGLNNTNFWTKSGITTNQQGTAFVNGWNLIQVNWNQLSQVGSPSISNIKFVSVDFVTNSPVSTAQVFRIDSIESILGSILEYEYYSKYLFRDATTGAFQETVTDDSNLINLDTESYNLLFNLVAYMALQQQQGLDAQFYDGQFFLNAYMDALAKYKARYKSELQKPQSNYYGMPSQGYNKVIGRRLFY